MLQPKDTDWLNRYKHKTHIYAVYKRPTSDLDTHILSQSERMEKYIPCKWEMKAGSPWGHKESDMTELLN